MVEDFISVIMDEQSKEMLRGVTILVPLVLFVIVLLALSRERKTQQNVEKNSHLIERYDTIVPTSFLPFDPNTADYATLLRAGVPRNIAVNLIRWRTTGKVFRIKEDLALCYGMTDSMYFVLEPYITIAEEFRIKPRNYNSYSDSPHEQRAATPVEYTTFRLDTVTADYLSTIGFTPRQAALVVRYRDMIGGYRNIEEFAECYAVGDSVASLLKPYIVFDEADDTPSLVELNSADSAALRSVAGIGEKSVMEILRYRDLLGGYYSVEQLSELDVVTERNFEKISQQIYCDSARIKKININFASPKALEAHPYITSRALRRIVNKRQLKGGWSTVEELIEDDIFSEDEAKHIAPYLSFGTHSE